MLKISSFFASHNKTQLKTHLAYQSLSLIYYLKEGESYLMWKSSKKSFTPLPWKEKTFFLESQNDNWSCPQKFATKCKQTLLFFRKGNQVLWPPPTYWRLLLLLIPHAYLIRRKRRVELKKDLNEKEEMMYTKKRVTHKNGVHFKQTWFLNPLNAVQQRTRHFKI